MVNVNVYLFVLSGDSLLNVEAHKSAEDFVHKLDSNAEAGFYSPETQLEKIKKQEKLREEAFSEIAFAAIKDNSDPGGHVEKLQERYFDMLPHCLEYIGVWAVENDKVKIFQGSSFTLEAFVVACGKAFLNGWAPYGTAWATVFEIHNPETGEVSYRHSDIQAEI